MENEADDDSRTVFCANLHKNVTEEILYELFLQAGPVQRVKIPQNNNYGFVTYRHLCSIDYALEIFQDTELYGNPLRLKRRQARRDDSNKVTNSNSVLQTGNNFVHMHPNMMPQNLQQNYHNMYQNNYSANKTNKHERSRSPHRNRHNDYHYNHGSHHPAMRRIENKNRHNKRYEYDDKYDNRHHYNDRHNRKKQKR